MYLNKYIKLFIVFIIFSPLVIGIYKNLLYLIDIRISNYFTETFRILMINSITLSLVTAIISVILGIIIYLIFIYISSKNNIKYFYLILLFSLFSINPMIYLNAFQNFVLFNNLPIFIQSFIAMGMPLSFLSGLIFILSLSILDFDNIHFTSLIASRKNLFKFMIKPKFILILIINFFIISILVFNSFNVPSILGYRTYAEDFLMQISLMENLNSIAMPSLPFYIMSVFLTITILYIINKFKITFYTMEKTNLEFKYSNYSLIGVLIILSIYLFIFAILLKNIDFANILNLYKENISVILYSVIIAIIISIVTLILAMFIYNTIKKFKSNFIIFIITFLSILLFLLPSTSIALEIISIKQLFDIINMDFLFYLFSNCLKLTPIALLLIFILHYRTVTDETILFLNISRFNKFLKIILPLYFKKWLLIIIILMIFALNEVALNIILIPIGLEIIVIKVYNLLHYGDYSTITFLSLIQVLIILMITLISLYTLYIRKKLND